MGPAKNAPAARVVKAASHSLAKHGNKPAVRAPSSRIAGVVAPPIPAEAPRADDHARGKVQKKKHELAEAAAASALAGMNQEEEEEEEEDTDVDEGAAALNLVGGAAAAADDDEDGADDVANSVACKPCSTKPEPEDGDSAYEDSDAIVTRTLAAFDEHIDDEHPLSAQKAKNICTRCHRPAKYHREVQALQDERCPFPTCPGGGTSCGGIAVKRSLQMQLKLHPPAGMVDGSEEEKGPPSKQELALEKSKVALQLAQLKAEEIERKNEALLAQEKAKSDAAIALANAKAANELKLEEAKAARERERAQLKAAAEHKAACDKAASQRQHLAFMQQKASVQSGLEAAKIDHKDETRERNRSRRLGILHKMPGLANTGGQPAVRSDAAASIGYAEILGQRRDAAEAAIMGISARAPGGDVAPGLVTPQQPPVDPFAEPDKPSNPFEPEPPWAAKADQYIKELQPGNDRKQACARE